MSQPLEQILNKQIANWSVLYIKLHHYHWFVTGSHFYELHKKFEEFYNEAAAYIDDIAERLLAIGGTPLSTMQEFLEQASIHEADEHENAGQMVKNIIADFTIILNELKQGIENAAEEKDDPTADLLIKIRTALEKHIWMLKSFIKED
ncbi:Dps family protein [Bacillus taeanensis]|uniref:DNA starvation/stationary phase protection protein n=1 Tax=Bacillus taeanensis TaxID=273032 RepID=A0A366XSW0_9BACI|nr:Dps family protein [Bacillus taeanensis]RBW68977.1 DNA starvation/stationary phase protection protein [Bacillus taeanensis]